MQALFESCVVPQMLALLRAGPDFARRCACSVLVRAARQPERRAAVLAAGAQEVLVACWSRARESPAAARVAQCCRNLICTLMGDTGASGEGGEEWEGDLSDTAPDGSGGYHSNGSHTSNGLSTGPSVGDTVVGDWNPASQGSLSSLGEYQG